jgi:antitoxin HicB
MIDLSAYQYVVSRAPDEDGGYFIVRFFDIPGCLGVGETEEEAVEDGRRALFACIDALKAVDRTPPAPSAQPSSA